MGNVVRFMLEGLPRRIARRYRQWGRTAAERKLLRDVARYSGRQAASFARDQAVSAVEPLNFFNDAECAKVSGLERTHILWATVGPEEVQDRWAAARFAIDAWRTNLFSCRQAVRRGEGPLSIALAQWVEQQGSHLGLGAEGIQRVSRALTEGNGLAARARQAFLVHREIPVLFPQGLTPAGWAPLFRWFMRSIRQKLISIRPEEVWWLFLEAQFDPEREIVRAHAFTPEWQRRHPAGTTRFGADAFSVYLRARYGAAGGWTNPERWPMGRQLATQIRQGFLASAQWRARHPRALLEPASAEAFINWLSNPGDSGLDSSLAQWVGSQHRSSLVQALAAPAVNLFGHFCYPSGLRVSAEAVSGALRSAGCEVAMRDVHTGVLTDEPRHALFDASACHDISILHVQPEPYLDDAWRRAQVAIPPVHKHSIGYWYWEFDDIPPAWARHAQSVDEVWVATEFIARGMRRRLPVPVHTLFPGVQLAPFEKRGKRDFGLDPECFTFLFTFHMMSVMERKNPLGLIRAFNAAFSPHEKVSLVIKTHGGEHQPAHMEALLSAAEGARIQIMDVSMSQPDVLSLMDACDAYVSLHRSEGLGLSLAEAMLLGKPVIATNFSGNTDFMDEGNSLPVRYMTEPLGRPYPPYHEDLVWARPDESHAADLMRSLVDAPDLAGRLGARAKASAEERLSPVAAGRRMRKRLEEIRRAWG